MVSTMHPQEIHSILEQQQEISQELLQLLTQEFSALSGNDLQAIETTLAAKQLLMERLDEISREFLAVASLHAPDKKDGIAIFLRHEDPQGSWGLVPLWQQIDKLLSQCHQKNSINGKIISLNQRHNQQALEILRHGGQESQACYSSTGACQSSASSRILGKV